MAMSALTGSAADNQLSEKEKSEGWILLFDGETLNGWSTNERKPSRRPVEDASLNPHKCGGYLLVHEKDWADFILSLDFKISKRCNSGVFVRLYPLMKNRDWNQFVLRGIETAIDDTTGAGYHDTGAFYDLVKPRENAMKPAGQWNHLVIHCDANIITAELNGEHVNRMDLDEWTERGKRPDGTRHKYANAICRDHPRHGYIALQDHGSNCWFKNIKIKPLNGTATQPTSTHAAK